MPVRLLIVHSFFMMFCPITRNNCFIKNTDKCIYVCCTCLKHFFKFVYIQINLYLAAFHRKLLLFFSSENLLFSFAKELINKLFRVSAAKCFLNRSFPSLVSACPYIEFCSGGSIHHRKTKHFQRYTLYADNK